LGILDRVRCLRVVEHWLEGVGIGIFIAASLPACLSGMQRALGLALAFDSSKPIVPDGA
jgi:hypothetical protein